LKNEVLGLGNCTFGARMGNDPILVKSLVEEIKEGNTLKLSRTSEFQNKKNPKQQKQEGDTI